MSLHVYHFSSKINIIFTTDSLIKIAINELKRWLMLSYIFKGTYRASTLFLSCFIKRTTLNDGEHS